jgi:hypothetical protein
MEQENKTLGHRPTGEAQGKIVQTYAEDMAKVIEDDTQGLIKKMIHGEEEREIEKKNLSPESQKNKLFMLVSILLLAMALGVVSFFVFIKEDINTVVVEKQFVPIIFNDKSTFFEVFGLKKEEIIQTVLNQVNDTSVKIGGVDGIYLTENKQIIGLRRFITLIKSSFVPGDDTLLVKDNFLMGSFLSGLKATSPTAGDFFILLKVRSTLDVFNTLRTWEEKMLTDLHGFLGINLSSETNYLFKKDFDDGIIENKNARILYDKEGKIVLMYIFADENSVIITNSQPATHEIILRLASSEKKQ